MTAPALYEVETSEGDDGTPHPVERLWTACAEDAAGAVSSPTAACTSLGSTT
ncbi:hypothetical protein [Streptomyces huasconensis]|uniref:hypothetical protein n=1 Tax=Streptomyces huasconensis TaxID=1854574 RepID=UPI003405A0F9